MITLGLFPQSPLSDIHRTRRVKIQEVFAISECILWPRLKVACTSKQRRQLRCEYSLRISPDPERHAQPWMLELFPAGKHRHRKIRVGEAPDRDVPELGELVQLPIEPDTDGEQG
jgi:hypothetical protein